MNLPSNQSSGSLWHKFRSSTKSLSSSLSNLSIKGESDGDSPTSTVVHKSLVRFYKNQEPFTGFPGWLGHKEDLPNEQKILKRQSHGGSNPISSGFSHIRKASLDHKKSHSKSHSFFNEQEEHTSAGMAFHRIYNSEPPTITPTQLDSSAPVNHAIGGHSAGSTENGLAQPHSPTPTGTSTTSMLMRERLKRQNTKTSYHA